MDQKNSRQEKRLSTLCKPDKLTRCDFFSDTYTATLTVNGEKKAMDITHISLPFKSNREKAVMKYFGIDRDDMEGIYAALASGITNNAKTTTYLNRNNVQSVMNILKIETVKKIGRGSDIYMVTEHLRPMSQTYFNGETTLGNIFNLGTRLAKLAKDVHQAGEDSSVSIRAIDPEQIYVDNDGKYVFGCFQYAFNEQTGQEPLPMAETAPLHIHPNVSAGQKGDIGTDMYTISSILWSLLNGDGFDKVTPTGTPPKYATEEMVAVLEMGFNADPEMFTQFRRQLNEIMKKLTKSGDSSVTIPVPKAEPCINAQLARLDIEEEEVFEKPAEAVPVLEEPEPVPVEEEPEVVEPVSEDPEKLPEEISEPEEIEEIEEVVEVEEEPVAAVPLKRLNIDDYLEHTEAEADIVPDSSDSIMEFTVVYNKPKFLFRQLLVAIAIGLILAVVVYVSVTSHMISLI